MKKLSKAAVINMLGYDVKNQFPRQLVRVPIATWARLLDSGMVDSSVAYQRDIKASWLKPSFRGAVADSILRDFSIGVIHAILREDGVIEIIDGKQRTQFIALTLSGAGEFEGIEIDDSLNKSFLEWDLKSRERFLNYNLDIMLFNGLDDEGRRLQFERLNAGVALSGYEKRRAGIVGICGLDEVKKSAEALLEILPPVAGRARSYQMAEEIILQALSLVVCDNYDFSGSGVVESLRGADSAKIRAGAVEVLRRVQAFIKLWSDAGEFQKGLKWALKKSALSVILGVDCGKGGYNYVNFTTFMDYDKVEGSDQLTFKVASASASASPTNVKTRFEVIQRVQTGRFTKTEKIRAVKKSVSEVADSDGASPLEREVLKPFTDTWGEEFATPELVGMVLSRCAGRGLSDIKPRVEKSGVKTLSFLDKNLKAHRVRLDEVLGLRVAA